MIIDNRLLTGAKSYAKIYLLRLEAKNR